MKTNSYIKLTLFLILMVTAFHLCIIVKFVPYNLVWGGRLKTESEMYTFEIISVFINLFLILILLMKGGYLKFEFHKKAVNSILWIFLFIFIFNTIGNVLADTAFEKMFSVLTLLLAILLGNILIKKEKRTEE